MFSKSARVIRSAWRYFSSRRDPVAYARSIGVRVGQDCRILADATSCFGSEPYLVTLLDHVTIASGVSFITHDGGVWIFRVRDPEIDYFGPIVVGNNVFIGIRVIIMPGVTIGDNCVIGAGSIVTRNVPAGHVYAGVPARNIKTVDQYWQDLQGKLSHVRSWPEHKKRAYLEQSLLKKLM